jgi:DNA invertase Pin-like site-specific DNA recombinase
MTRALLTSLLLIALIPSVAAMPAWAQGAGDHPAGGERPPTELWDEFPLKQPAPGGANQGGGQSAAPAPGSGQQGGGDDGSSGTSAPLLVGLAGLAGLGAAVLVGIGIHRRRSRAAAAGQPALALAAGSGKPAGAAELPADGRTPTAPSAKAAAAPEPVTPPKSKPPGTPKVEPAPAANAAAQPQAPPAPAPGEPSPGRPAPDRTEQPDGRPAVLPVPAVAVPRDGLGPRKAPTPGSRPSVAGQRAVGYASVSAADDLNNAELKVQVRLIQEACQQRGLTLVKIVRDVESHASSDLRRPGLTYALDRLAARDASCLVVSSLERLTRTAANLGALLGWLTECDARLIVIDLDLDTGTEEGQLGARALATVGGLERRKLEERTRKGLEAARHMRRSGRPAVSDRPSLKQRIADMRAQGMTLQAIADTLNAEGVPTLRGGAEWRPSSVQAAAGYKRPRRKGVLHAPAPPRDKSA